MPENNSVQNDNVVPIHTPDSPFKLKEIKGYLEVLQAGAFYERLAYHGGNSRGGEDLSLLVRDMRSGERYAFVTNQPMPDQYFMIEPGGGIRKVTREYTFVEPAPNPGP